MRVLLLLDHYQEDETGMLVYRFCQRWAPMRRLSLFAAAFAPHGPLAERFRALGIGTQSLPFDGFRHIGQLRAAGQQLLHTADRPDIIQSHCQWPDIAARLFHGNAPNVPLITSVHFFEERPRGEWLPGFMTGLADRALRKGCSAIVPHTSAIRRRLEASGIDSKKLRNIPMGIDAVQTFPLSEASRLKFRALLGVEPTAPLLVYTGRDNDHLQSDVVRLLHAFAILHEDRPDARLFLVGENLRQPLFEKCVSERKLQECVRFIGDITEALPKLYSTADVVLRSTSPATFAFGVAEAQASGTPAIAFVKEDARDFRPDRETGQLYPVDDDDLLSRAILLPHAKSQGDPGPLVAALRELLENEEGRRALGQSAREFILQHHELAETAKSYVELWSELAPEAVWKETGSIPVEEIAEFRKASAGAGWHEG